MNKTISQDTTATPEYEINLSEIYEYILGPDWGNVKTSIVEKPTKKADERDAERCKPKKAN